MENKARYTLVGLFIVIFTMALVSFLLWQARYVFSDVTLLEFRLYSKKSIAGLNEKSFVEYKGLSIGVVDKIRINPENSEEIEVILKINQQNIIKEDSFAIIQSKGISGNKMIEINGGASTSKPLVPKEDMTYAIIPLNESFLDNITNNAQSITTKVDNLLNKLDILISKKNMNNIESSLSNTSNATHNLNKTIKDIDKLIENDVKENVNITSENLNKTIKDIDSLIQNEIKKNIDELFKQRVPKTFNNVDNLTKEWSLLSQKLQKLIDNDIVILLNNANDTLDAAGNIEELLLKAEETLEKVDETLEEFNENGGDMIFKTRDEHYGPREKKDEK